MQLGGRWVYEIPHTTTPTSSSSSILLPSLISFPENLHLLRLGAVFSTHILIYDAIANTSHVFLTWSLKFFPSVVLFADLRHFCFYWKVRACDRCSCRVIQFCHGSDLCVVTWTSELMFWSRIWICSWIGCVSGYLIGVWDFLWIERLFGNGSMSWKSRGVESPSKNLISRKLTLLFCIGCFCAGMLFTDRFDPSNFTSVLFVFVICVGLGL